MISIWDDIAMPLISNELDCNKQGILIVRCLLLLRENHRDSPMVLFMLRLFCISANAIV